MQSEKELLSTVQRMPMVRPLTCTPLVPNPDINSYMTKNSYYESNNIVVSTTIDITSSTSLPAQDLAVINKLGSTYDKLLCLVLNERTRELCVEFQHWEDLSRTKTLIPRAKAYNPEVAVYIKNYHLLRPIPKTFLDAIYSNGAALTATEKQAMQNARY